VNDDEVDVVLARIRHRDAIRILIASAVLGVPALIPALLGLDLGPVLNTLGPAVLSLCVFAAVTAALHLRRNRERYARIVELNQHRK
jgi:hypothetical protein